MSQVSTARRCVPLPSARREPYHCSYVVNGHADRRNISRKTRKRMIGVMQEMNYRPDILAQALQGVRTRTIGVLWSLTGYNPITAMVNEIALIARRHNFASYLADHLNDPDATVNALEDFASRRVDAVVIDAAPRDASRQANYPGIGPVCGGRCGEPRAGRSDH